MSSIANLSLTGESGNKYQFSVYPFDTNFKSVGAVYAITRRTVKADGNGDHAVIYIGETEDLGDRFDNHHKAGCFDRHNANCICIHRDDGARSRLAKEADLIKAESPACNG